jgi:glucans biosynthesis protein
MGHFSKAIVLKNDFEKSWRVFLKFEPAPGFKEPVPLRCTLKKGETVLTETWDYLWNPR